MQDVVGVVFRRLGKVYHFDPDGLSLLPGDKVIVRTQNGTELGEVSEALRKLEDEHVEQPLKKVVRRAQEDDLAKRERNQQKEAEAFAYAKVRIAESKLAMQLFQVEQSFDGSKMTFYFTAESRVDFRDLVRELAGHYKTRIELRQIGVRDKAKMVGGLGHCGQNLCCATYLSDLNPVSIRMAKEQNLSLNPIKISGVCGRLMCCLQYEYGAYKDFNKRAPGKGACIETCSGHKGCVIEQNPVRERLKIRDDDGVVSEIPLEDVKCVTERRGPKPQRQESRSAAPAEGATAAEKPANSGRDSNQRPGGNPRRERPGGGGNDNRSRRGNSQRRRSEPDSPPTDRADKPDTTGKAPEASDAPATPGTPGTS